MAMGRSVLRTFSWRLNSTRTKMAVLTPWNALRLIRPWLKGSLTGLYSVWNARGSLRRSGRVRTLGGLGPFRKTVRYARVKTLRPLLSRKIVQRQVWKGHGHVVSSLSNVARNQSQLCKSSHPSRQEHKPQFVVVKLQFEKT